MDDFFKFHRVMSLPLSNLFYYIRHTTKCRTSRAISCFLLLFLLAFTFKALANDTHMQLALKFEDLSSSSDKEALVDSMIPYFQMQTDGGEAEMKKIRSFLIQSLQSEDYRIMKANIYKRQFSKEELELLIELVSSPAYKLLNSKRYDIAIDTQQSMLIFLQKSMENMGE
ncbi:hypothetical protein CEQ32_12330 [Shewanella sp. FDAARGOS_354]|nr:hypothetical protein CEQ32_12330 [Shewanella sp. FDAARGOS_354]